MVGTLLLFGVILLSLGCTVSKKEADNIAKEQSHIKSLAIMYCGYISQNQGRMPPNDQIFKQYVQAMIAKQSSDNKGPNAEEIFISERDQKPYVILFGRAAQSGPRNGPADLPVVIYEQDGVDGRRFVASSMGAIEEVDEEQFQRLVPIRK